MQKIKQYWAIILLVVVISGGLLYWYEWRPIRIRQKCNDIAFNNLTANAKSGNASGMYLAAESAYSMCVRSKGLEK